MEFYVVFYFTILSLQYIRITEQSSPPSSRQFKGKSRESIYTKHYETHVAEPTINLRNPTLQSYRTTVSDAMELYSIAAKRILVVQQMTGSKVWDHESELSLSRRHKPKGRENKFVTETVSYGRLKIKSEDNGQYLCVRTDGSIIFKESAENLKKRKPRKRCLFNMSFTRQMHIKLSVTPGSKTWYLTVKNDKVIMTENSKVSDELSHSFMWLPTQSANPSPKMSRLRNFDEDVETVCDSYNEKIKKQKKEIRTLYLENVKQETEIAILRALKEKEL